MARHQTSSDSSTAEEFGAGDLWHALLTLANTHPRVAGLIEGCDPPEAFLTFDAAPAVLYKATAQLTGLETPAELRAGFADLADRMALALDGTPGLALDVVVGRRQEILLHTAQVQGLTRLALDACDTIGRPGQARSGQCGHCSGTGTARLLWPTA